VSLSDLCPRPRWVSLLDDGPEPVVGAAQGYRLRVERGEPTITATDASGTFYAEATLAQLRRLHPGGVPDVTIVDWPAIAHRGVMLDVSRDKVPTVESLELLVDRMAALKMNVVQLYLEHTFAHPGHDEVCAPASPYTAADVARLRAYCGERHVELIGQQNSLGHMERWLAHPRYAELAALPGGYRDGLGGHEPAACLDPSHPGSFPLAAELVSNVAVAFDAARVHVGLDEPIDLSPGVWDAIFDVPGAEAPWAHVDNGAFCVPLPPDRRAQYMSWIRALRALPALDGREMLMWADVMAPHPELLDELPDGVTLVEWGYEAEHPFDARCGRIARAGRRFWVAPGTSTWSSLAGRVANMSANVTAAVEAAIAHGADGLLVCDWGNEGHFQYHPVSWPGFVTAAARAWNPGASVDPVTAIGHHITGDLALASATVRLGRVDELIRPGVPEAGTLASLLAAPHRAAALAEGGMEPAMLDDVERELEGIVGQVDSSNANVTDAAVWADELRATAGWLRLASWRTRQTLGWAGAPETEVMLAEYARLLGEHERLWLARNRPGGLDDSLRRLGGAARHVAAEGPHGIDHA
jgi:hypothetical protein